MRQGHQNKRGRGRARKNSNPLSRNYESNGPDVKIRGSASHIADKYKALARDAHATGDPVTAENYFQHAEHYTRIIMAAQTQREEMPNGAGRQEGRQQPRPARESVDGAKAANTNNSNGQAAEEIEKPALKPSKGKVSTTTKSANGETSTVDGKPKDEVIA